MVLRPLRDGLCKLLNLCDQFLEQIVSKNVANDHKKTIDLSQTAKQITVKRLLKLNFTES